MKNKYKVTIKGAEVDVYDILVAYEIVNPAIQHAVKKLLKAGDRGYKDKTQDYNEAIQSIERAKELEYVKDRAVLVRSEHLVCDVCGSDDVIEAPHMGKNCNRCHPL